VGIGATTLPSEAAPSACNNRGRSDEATALNPVTRVKGALLFRRGKSNHPMAELGRFSRSRTMLVAFGGINSRLGIAPYEFSSLTGRSGVKRLYVRDLHQAWYHRGMPGHGDELMDVAATLGKTVAQRRVERLVVVGTSAGGYAALVFGTLLGADLVLAFSPQTTLDLESLGQMDDHRWDAKLQALEDDAAFDRDWIDLARALPAARHAQTQYRVYFDATHMDRAHGERLDGLDGVRLFRFGRGEHELVRQLRDVGALSRMIEHATRPT
jgi:pimeloyl-ACP methyl ester carboxylesterase